MSELPKVRRARLGRSQKDSDEFHMWMGHCITAWAEVDDTLFNIFRHCVGPKLQCAIIYYKTPSLEARFSLTDEIVRSILPKKKPGEHDHTYVKRWDKAIKTRADLLAVRRRIAHHPVAANMQVFVHGALATMPPDRMPIGGNPIERFSWLELYMSDGEKLRGRDAHLSPLRVNDLEGHFDAVGHLSNDLLGFLIEVILEPSAGLSLPSTTHR